MEKANNFLLFIKFLSLSGTFRDQFFKSTFIKDSQMIIIPTFRSVSIGNERLDLPRELRSAGVYLDRIAASIVAVIGARQTPQKTVVDTVLVTPRDLGFGEEDMVCNKWQPSSIPPNSFFDRARNFGLIKCRDIITPELLIQHGANFRSMRGRAVRVYMSPLSGGPSPNIDRAFSFGVGKHGLSLSTSDDRHEIINLHHPWLFEKCI